MAVKKELLVKMYKDIVRVRKLDEKFIELLVAGKLSVFYHSGQGHEATGVALCASLRDDDYLFYNHRSHGTNKCLPRGMTAESLLAEHFGKANGAAHGLAGFHYAEPALGILGKGGMVGGEFTLAAGVGIACQLKGKGQIVACCVGDGALGRGTFHEAMLMAATMKLPVLWIVENNMIQQFTPLNAVFPKENLAGFADGFGIPSDIVDGQDVLAVYEAFQPAIKRARLGQGPTLLEIKTYRYRAHLEGVRDYAVQIQGEEGRTRPQEEVDAWKKRDPIKLFEKTLTKMKVLKESDFERIDREAKEEMDEAERRSIEGSYPISDDLERALYAESVKEVTA